MKKLLIALTAGILMLGSVGCSQLETSEDWERVAPTVTRITEISFITALQVDGVKEHKAELCDVIYQVADVLDKIEDPTTTFDQLQQKALDVVNNSDLPPKVKQIALIVVDQVLDVTFRYVETYYNGLMQEDKIKVIVIVTKAVADGFRSACDGLPDPATVCKQSVFP